MNEQVYIVSDILKALSNPNRLMIVCLLQEKRLTVTDLHEKMNNISILLTVTKKDSIFTISLKISVLSKLSICLKTYTVRTCK